jgi:hypothetical protein
MGDGQIFSTHISCVPFQHIFKEVEGLQKELHNQPLDVYFYKQLKKFDKVPELLNSYSGYTWTQLS